MKPVHSVLAVLLASAVAVGQKAAIPPEIGFQVNLEPARVDFVIVANETPCVGVVLISTVPDVAHYLVDLPPLLAHSFVLAAVPSTAARMSVSFPDTAFPPGIELHVQGVTVSEVGIRASQVESFVLDASGEG